MIQYKTGNVITEFEKGDYQLLLHGCNCFHTMGSGIAKAIKDRYPEAYDADKRTVYGDYNKLGTVSYIRLENNVVVDDSHIMTSPHSVNDTKYKYIINCYTQYSYGTDMPHLNYPALEMCFDKIASIFPYCHKIIMGKIGCVRAGGDWEVVSKIINKYFEDVTVYELPLKNVKNYVRIK